MEPKLRQFDRERAESCCHRWSHYPENPTTAVPRPYCVECGLDVDNLPSHVWLHGHTNGTVN